MILIREREVYLRMCSYTRTPNVLTHTPAKLSKVHTCTQCYAPAALKERGYWHNQLMQTVYTVSHAIKLIRNNNRGLPKGLKMPEEISKRFENARTPFVL